MQPLPVGNQDYDIGKSVIFQVNPTWNGSDDLFASLTHIGTTEGDVEMAMNPTYSELTLPESSGPAALIRYLTGERPTFKIGVFPNPDNLKIFSPTGTGSAGQERQRRVKEYTLWIVSEQLFLATDPVTGVVGIVPVTFDGSVFKKDGNDLTAAEQRLVDMSMLIWRADFERLAPKYHHADGGKSIVDVTVTCQQDFTKPDGCQIALMVGEAELFGVDFVGS
jgi:hypothetical protein